MTSTPTPGLLRREPYRVFFPLGVALSWWGVGPWLLVAVGWLHGWPSIFHSIAQIEGFLACFAVGFLFTMLPRRTGTPAPTRTEMAIGLAAPVALTAAAWFDEVPLSQVAWIAVLGMLIRFAVPRIVGRDVPRRPPHAFVWIPAGLAMALGGTVAMAIYHPLDLPFTWHVFGQGLLLQGLFLSLVVGVGAMLLPLLTRRQSSVDGDTARPGRRWPHVAAAVTLAGSFAVEAFAVPAIGFAMRAAVTGGVLVLSAGIHRLPTAPGLHRRLVWLSAWAIPLGYALAAAMPNRHQVGLHVVFIMGFGLMALMVGLHVTLAHGGRQDLVHRTVWQVPASAVLLVGAVVARGLVVLDPLRTWLWLGVAAGAYLVATLPWLALAWAGYAAQQPDEAHRRSGEGRLRIARGGA